MRILHLSDFHYKSAEKDIASQNILVGKLCEELKKENKIDFLLFTGDLVNSGKEKKDFTEAYNTFLREVGHVLNLKKRQIILCPGNHDINRDIVSNPIKEYIRRIKANDELTAFVEKNDPNEFGLSLRPTENYYEFEREFYKEGEKQEIDKIGKLFSVHFREVDDKKLGFVCINTAWCSTGKDDRGNLFFPKSELEKALNMLNKNRVDWKILVLHHPVSDLRDFNKIDIEDFIYSEFDFMFSGHLHKRDDFIKLTLNEGIFGTYANAAFTKKEDGKIGYSILDIDFNTLDVKLKKYIYDFDEKIFIGLNEMIFNFPCDENKANQIKVYKTLRKRLSEVIDKADELLVSFKDHNPNKSFLELFVDPVLKNQPDLGISKTPAASLKIDFKNLYSKKNYLIYGSDKTGKTAILYKLQIELLKNYTQLSEIPIYIDLNDYKMKPDSFDLTKLASRFLEASTEKTITILKNYAVKVLVDNFDPAHTKIIKKLSDFFSAYPNCNYVIMADQTLVRSYEKLDYGIDGYNTLFIHDIARKEIRLLTKKWPNIPENKREEFIERIIDVLKQHNMPFNFWTLSIFLWIFSGKNTLNFNNNSELIELYIDDLLDRNRLASDPQNRFSYQNYKLLLSELGHLLLTQHATDNHTIKYSDFISFTEKFMQENPKRVGNTSEVVSYLLERGVLKKLDEDYITFRLNGVFEYFIAFDFNENNNFLEEIIADDKYYLSFKNEFEIYSGFQRTESENKAFLNKIYSKTKQIFNELNERMTGDLDTRLSKSIEGKELLDLTQPIAALASSPEMLPFTDDQKDEIFEGIMSAQKEEVGVRPKRIYDVSVKNFEILERFLIINGRVFKNIENIKDKKYIEEIFDFIIDSSCNLGFQLIEELENSVDKNTAEVGGKKSANLILSLLNNHLPSVVQVFIHDAMGHINLEGIIKEKITVYKSNSRNNQYKLFLLHSLLLDLDFKKYKGSIDEMIDMAKNGVIKTSILVKLLMLLLFKVFDDDNMIDYIKEKIRKVNILINPKANMKDFDKNFEKTRKILLLQRRNSE